MQIYVKELKMYVENKIHDKNKSIEEIIVPNGLRLMNPYELAYLYGSDKYSVALNLQDTNEFCYDEEKKHKDRVCVFYSDKLDCQWLQRMRHYKHQDVGVRFVLDALRQDTIKKK